MADACFALAETLVNADEYDEAKKTYERALRIKSGSYWIHEYTSLLERMGLHQQAQAILKNPSMVKETSNSGH